MRGLAATLTWLAVLFSTGAAQALPPDPHVIDQAHILFETTRVRLEAESNRIAQETGVEVFIVTQQNLNGRSAREAALAVPVWDPSREQVVVLLAMTNRQVRIEASPSIVRRLPDAEWARLIQTEMLPELRKGRNGAAVRAGLDAIGVKLAGHQTLRQNLLPAGDGRPLRDLLFVLVAGVLAVVSFNGRRHLRIERGRW